MNRYVQWLQQFVDRFWYAPFVGLLAALDALIVIVPTDGILISSTLLSPKRWVLFALTMTIGSTIGAVVLAALVEFHGLPWILEYFPGINESSMWLWTSDFFEQYGLFLVFVVAMTPLPQQATIILASLAFSPLLELAVVIFIGRLIKFLAFSYIASHAPGLVTRIWGIKGELNEVGVKIGPKIER